jgi:hypothetical protein
LPCPFKRTNTRPLKKFKGFFLRPTFAVKELIQTPIERQCRKMCTLQVRDERGLLVVYNHSSQVAKIVQHCVKRINLRLLYTRCELSGSSDWSAPPPLPLPPPRCAEEGGIKTYFSYAVFNRRYEIGGWVLEKKSFTSSLVERWLKYTVCMEDCTYLRL